MQNQPIELPNAPKPKSTICDFAIGCGISLIVLGICAVFYLGLGNLIARVYFWLTGVQSNPGLLANFLAPIILSGYFVIVGNWRDAALWNRSFPHLIVAVGLLFAPWTSVACYWLARFYFSRGDLETSLFLLDIRFHTIWIELVIAIFLAIIVRFISKKIKKSMDAYEPDKSEEPTIDNI